MKQPIATAPLGIPILVYDPFEKYWIAAEGKISYGSKIKFWTLPEAYDSDYIYEPEWWMDMPPAPEKIKS